MEQIKYEVEAVLCSNKKNSPVSYKINDQLTSSVVWAHLEHLKAVNIKEWIIPTDNRLL